MKQERAGALIVLPDAFFFAQARRIAELAAQHRLPTMFWTREPVESGGLMSYGQNIAEHYYRAATYVDKILKGAKPGDLPVEQPTKIELVINLKTAKAIGLTDSAGTAVARGQGDRVTTRRKLLLALGTGALAAPLACFAQQQRSKVARIGLLEAASASSYAKGGRH